MCHLELLLSVLHENVQHRRFAVLSYSSPNLITYRLTIYPLYVHTYNSLKGFLANSHKNNVNYFTFKIKDIQQSKNIREIQISIHLYNLVHMF